MPPSTTPRPDSSRVAVVCQNRRRSIFLIDQNDIYNYYYDIVDQNDIQEELLDSGGDLPHDKEDRNVPGSTVRAPCMPADTPASASGVSDPSDSMTKACLLTWHTACLLQRHGNDHVAPPLRERWGPPRW